MSSPHVVELVGVAPPGVRFFTTLEGGAGSGSIKDRMVEPELDRLLVERGAELRRRAVAEISAGSTARSLAYHCRAREIPFVAFVDAASPDLAGLQAELQAMGATVRCLSGTIAEMYAAYDRECSRDGVVPFRQFDDPAKRTHYVAFGNALRGLLPAIHHVVGAVGTGHSLVGTAAAFPDARAHSAEPLGIAVAGVRNLDKVWFGDTDPLRGDRDVLDRAFVSAPEMFEAREVSSNLGTLAINDSFRLVLGAARRIASQWDAPASCLLIGAANRLKS